MIESTQASRDKLRRYCRLLRYLCDGLFCFVALMALSRISGYSVAGVFGSPAEPHMLLGHSEVVGEVGLGSFSLVQQVLLLTVEHLPWLFFLFLIYQFRQLFVAYELTPHFSQKKVSRLRNIGLLAMVLELSQVAGNLVQHWVLAALIGTLDGDNPMMQAGPEPGAMITVSIPLLLIGAGLFVLSLLMERSVLLEEESRLTV